MWNYMYGGAGWGHWLVMVLFWVVLVFAVVVSLRALSPRSRDGSGPPPRSALDILKERYARGEIGKDEFEQKKRDLQD
jgi:putative membrane protein